jgi:hypothetical protein
VASGQSITITIEADNKAAPTIQQVKADFTGLAEEIATAMDKANKKTEESGSKFGSVLKGVFGGVLSVVSGVAGAIGGVFSGAVKLVGSILGGLIDVAKAVVGGIIAAFKFLPDALGLVFNKVTALAVGAFGFVAFKLGEAAAKSEAMGKALERLAKKAGTSSSALVAAIKSGSGETITRLDAMRVANEALIAGLDVGPAKFEQLAAVADLLADAVGGNTAEAFAQLVQGIRAGNDGLLEAVGIHIEAKASYEDYASALGKSAEELTEAEKSQALLNDVLRESERLLNDAGASADLLGDTYDRIGVILKDSFTDAADAARPALLSIAKAIEPILVSAQAWIEVNRELIASEVGTFAEKIADAISRFANRLPDIVSMVGGGLSKAFDLAGRAGSIAWTAITDVIGGAIREFHVFRDAFIGLLEGRGFSIEGSVLLQTFRVIKTQAKVLAIEAAQAFAGSFQKAAVDTANSMIDLRNVFAEMQLLATVVANKTRDAGEFFTNQFNPRRIEARRQENAAAAIRATALPHLDIKSLQSVLGSELSSAQADAEVELTRLGTALDDVSRRGSAVREAASEAVGDLTRSVTEFFETDAERAARELEVTESANAAASATLQSSVSLSRAVVDEQLRRRREMEKIHAEFEELRRQLFGGTSAGGVQTVSAGG